MDKNRKFSPNGNQPVLGYQGRTFSLASVVKLWVGTRVSGEEGYHALSNEFIDLSAITNPVSPFTHSTGVQR